MGFWKLMEGKVMRKVIDDYVKYIKEDKDRLIILVVRRLWGILRRKV